MNIISARKYIWLSIALVSVVLGILGIIGTVKFALSLSYVPMAVSLALTTHGFYGTPFYFIAFANMRITERIILLMGTGINELEDISEKLRIKTELVRKLISKAESRGYISKAHEEKEK